MFDLDYEIDKWARLATRSGCASTSRIDEMKDHLYCSVEKFSEAGYPQAEAFRLAVLSAGDPGELSSEFFKNRSGGCGQSPDRGLSLRKIFILTLTYLCFFAAFTFAIRALVSDSKIAQRIVSVSFFFWLAPLVMMPGVLEAHEAERKFIRKLLSH